ncbi:MAG: HAMP domain-containing protein, partial [Ktedonobacteraceae bacterium]
MHWPAVRLSLRVKLVLSYLGVALGAILLLVVVISLAVQNYFYTAQIGQLRSEAQISAQQVGLTYQRASESWDFGARFEDFNPELVLVIDNNQQFRITHVPPFANMSNGDFQTVKQSLAQALQGQDVSGSLQGSSTDSTFFSGFYVSVPVYDGGVSGGKVIGALLLAQPYKYPQGFAPGDVLGTLDTVILITGAIIALLVVAFSVIMTRRLTRPLVSLTAAAEQMKGGDYSQRVDTPQSRDEIGALAQTFNDMAGKIETDVTELRRQDQLRRDMIANIAHDLVTPLTAIQGFSEAIADEVISAPEARYETAQLIGREVQRLRRLVSDMQNMTALETGRMQLDLAPLNVRVLVDEVLEVIGPECEQAGITLRNEIALAMPLVLADSDRITQVLLNLLDNARRYTPAGGSISVA